MTVAPRLIVEIPWGRMAGHKEIVAPGASLVVGRSERAGLEIAHDAQMSAEHFELSWDGARCRVRDLDSASGTRVGGQTAREAEVPHGGWIRAGKTDFSIFIEGFTPPRDMDDDEDAPGETVEEARAREAALAALCDEAAQGPLFAVLDAARDDRVLELARESVAPCRSLYEGPQAELFDEVAPRLVALSAGAPLLEALVVEGWGKRWGIYIAAPLAFADLRRHLRRFLLVEDDATGERGYFRYYDPATLRALLPASAPRQRADFFGDIDAFLCEGRRGEVVRLARGDLVVAPRAAAGAW